MILSGTEMGTEDLKDTSLANMPCDSLPLSPLKTTSVKVRFS